MARLEQLGPLPKKLLPGFSELDGQQYLSLLLKQVSLEAGKLGLNPVEVLTGQNGNNIAHRVTHRVRTLHGDLGLDIIGTTGIVHSPLKPNTKIHLGLTQTRLLAGLMTADQYTATWQKLYRDIYGSDTTGMHADIGLIKTNMGRLRTSLGDTEPKKRLIGTARLSAISGEGSGPGYFIITAASETVKEVAALKPPTYTHITHEGPIQYWTGLDIATSPLKPNVQIHLTRTESSVLGALMRNPCLVFSSSWLQQIINDRKFMAFHLDTGEYSEDSHTVKMHIFRLRHKMGDVGNPPKLIHTVKTITSHGYSLTAEVPVRRYALG